MRFFRIGDRAVNLDHVSSVHQGDDEVVFRFAYGAAKTGRWHGIFTPGGDDLLVAVREALLAPPSPPAVFTAGNSSIPLINAERVLYFERVEGRGVFYWVAEDDVFIEDPEDQSAAELFEDRLSQVGARPPHGALWR